MLHNGDDGCYTITKNGEKIGDCAVDSGRLWILTADFDAVVETSISPRYYAVLTVGENNVEKEANLCEKE